MSRPRLLIEIAWLLASLALAACSIGWRMRAEAELAEQAASVAYNYAYEKWFYSSVGLKLWARRHDGFNDPTICIQGVAVAWPLDLDTHLVRVRWGNPGLGKLEITIDGKPAPIILWSDGTNPCGVNLGYR